ncbi:MAG: prenyltransferase, partial [Eggerthella lenta]
LLVICVLMQSAVNTFNDYYDYVKGADSADDNVDPTDAVLVYNNVNPRAALALAVGFLAAAFLLGAYVIWIAGWIPLAIGAAGAVVVVLYSAGKTPISYLPIGELVSGFVMGGLIPLACYQALSGTFDLRALLWAVPTILGVGLIMFTNNTCDVEKDVESGRRTLSVLLGRERARKLYHGVVYAWVAAIVVLVAAFFTNGLLVMPFMLLASYPLLKALLGPVGAANRISHGAGVARTSHWARSTRRPSWQAASRSRSSGRNGSHGSDRRGGAVATQPICPLEATTRAPSTGLRRFLGCEGKPLLSACALPSSPPSSKGENTSNSEETRTLRK